MLGIDFSPIFVLLLHFKAPLFIDTTPPGFIDCMLISPFFLLSSQTMGRIKLKLRKIENITYRHVTYSKRKNGIIKKAAELSILCGTDVGVIMFSPTGRLTSFPGNGRIEDVLIRYINLPDQIRGVPIRDQEYLIRSLTRLKSESQIIELIADREALQSEFTFLNEQFNVAQEKIRYYTTDPEKITSVDEAEQCEKSIMNALRRIKQIKEDLLRDQTSQQEAESMEMPSDETTNADLMAEESTESNRIFLGDQSEDDQLNEATILPVGPHLSINFLRKQSNWNLPEPEPSI